MGEKIMRIRRIAEIMEALAQIPHTSVLGVIEGGKLLSLSLVQRDKALYSLDPESGKMERLTKGFVSLPSIPPYFSSEIYFARDVSSGKELHKLYKLDVNKKEEEEIEMEPMRITSIVHSDKVFFVGSKEKNTIYLVEGGKVEEVASFHEVFSITDYSQGLLVGSGFFKSPRSSELLLIKDGSVEIFTPKEGSVNENPIIVGDKIVFSSNFEGSPKLYVLDPETKDVERLEYEEIDRFSPYEFSFLWKGKDQELIAIAKKDGRSRVFVDGKEIKGPLGNYSTAFVVEGKVYATFTNSFTPSSVIELKENRFIFKPEVPEVLKGVVKEVIFRKIRSFDGTEVPTFIVLSSLSEVPGKAVMLVHGGPWAEDDDRFDVMTYSLASMGYHVIRSNYRGSTGYGPEHTLKIMGDPCGGELKDLIEVARSLKGEIAKEMCIAGYSYGGYMTLCALTKYPDEFKCGVAGASVADWEEMYELSDAIFKGFIELLFAGRNDLFKERSPITYAENLKAPLCLIQPQNDSRTPLKPVLKFMEKLNELGKTFEAHIIPNMGHALRTVDDMVNVLMPMLVFLEKEM
ncbi:peptidase S9 [Ignicoccus pacificus DSM 13166]|uniref:Peptidase S9 n=1 Tax=Ignicoccus pacificus DSM 13166 TaxID=940294 RepID=A0A977PJ74_9CREN|nr:peptidase S9 [Ignicoccus pacificus DSM 13166]